MLQYRFNLLTRTSQLNFPELNGMSPSTVRPCADVDVCLTRDGSIGSIFNAEWHKMEFQYILSGLEIRKSFEITALYKSSSFGGGGRKGGAGLSGPSRAEPIKAGRRVSDKYLQRPPWAPTNPRLRGRKDAVPISRQEFTPSDPPCSSSGRSSNRRGGAKAAAEC